MFIDRLKTLLSERGITWKDVSEELGIGKNQMKYWTDHNSVPDGNTLRKLAEYFGVSTDYLLGIDDIKNRLWDMLDETKKPDALTQRLIAYFQKSDEDGKLRIIQIAMNEYDRSESERKKAQAGNAVSNAG